MIDTPEILESVAEPTAVIRFTIPRTEIRKVMGPGRSELLATIAAQGIAPAGPVFSHHFRIDPDVFDFELGVSVHRELTSVGRVRTGRLPATRVARTVYHGPYEGLHAAWVEFDDWIVAAGHIPGPELMEFYVSGPEASSDPAQWRTELRRPVLT